jgi:hypothetical protein
LGILYFVVVQGERTGAARQKKWAPEIVSATRQMHL